MKRAGFAAGAVILLVAIAGQWELERAYAKAVAQSAAARREFRDFPAKVGRWDVSFVKLADRELEMLAVDDYLRAEFSSPDDAGWISVYAGYYRNPDRATQHPPTICYPGSGWLKTYEKTAALAPDGMRTLVVRETVFESGQAKTLVVYWYEIAGVKGASASRQKLIRLWRLLAGKGVTGVLKVQMSLTINTTRESAEKRLSSFLADFLPVLESYSPRDPNEVN